MKVRRSKLRRIIREEFRRVIKEAEDTEYYTMSPTDPYEYNIVDGVWVTRRKTGGEWISLANHPDSVERLNDKFPDAASIVAADTTKDDDGDAVSRTERRLANMSLASRAGRIMNLLSMEIYGPAWALIDWAAEGNYGPIATENANNIIDKDVTFSILSRRNPSYETTHHDIPVQFARDLSNVANNNLSRSGRAALDDDMFALAHAIFSRASGFSSPMEIENGLALALTSTQIGDLRREVSAATTMVNVADGDLEGISVSNPERYIRREVKKLRGEGNRVFPEDARIRNVDDAREYAEMADELVENISTSAREVTSGIQLLRSILDSDEDLTQLFHRAGIIPSTEELFRQIAV